jgi:hypothetical protein
VRVDRLGRGQQVAGQKVGYWGRTRSGFVEAWMVAVNSAMWKRRMYFGSVVARAKISLTVLVTSGYILDMLTM